MIKLLRVDYRLVHGQVAISWSRHIGADCILVANDEVAKDEMRQSMLRLSKPQGMKLVIKSIEDSVKSIKSGVTDKYKMFIVVNNIQDVERLAKEIPELNYVNLGVLPANENTKAVVIGAGLIGMKAAEGLVKICKSVDVVELAPRVLPSILDKTSARQVKKHLENNGIKFHLENTVVKAQSKGKHITGVTLKDGKTLKCDLLVLAVGVRPQCELAESAGLEVNRGIITDIHTMQTSDKDIYAAGDCTVSVDMLDGSKKIIALWPNAVQQGRVAGYQMASESNTVDGTYSVNAIDFFGLRICTCGLINAQGEQYFDKIKSDGDVYKRLVFEGDRLVGFVLINSSENAGIYTNLISNKVDLSTLEGDIMETPSIFLFDKDTRIQKLRGGILL